MARWDLLRVQDVRGAYRLIGECRDVGYDPALWHPRISEGLSRLIGAPMVSAGEGRWLRPTHPIKPLTAFAVGFDPRGHERLLAYRRENGPAHDPIYTALQHMSGRLLTHTRRQLVPDADWYPSVIFNEYRRLAGADHQLTSIYQVSDDGAVSGIGVNRAIGERDFSPREQQVLNFFHHEIGGLIGRALVSGMERGPEKLSPRLRQTLSCLLEGDSEQQVAARLGLSRPTTHQYVTALYRHFKVRSRAQLLAHVIKCMGCGRWKRLTSEPEDAS
jgi:DNA-binding CsgD family transcriptional regulator